MPMAGLKISITILPLLVGGETQSRFRRADATRTWQVIRHGGILVSTLGVRAVAVVLNPKAERQLQQIAQLIDAHQIEVTVEKTSELLGCSGC